MGEERFLRGVAQEHGVADFDATAAIAAFLEDYFVALAQPGVKIAYQGAHQRLRHELVAIHCWCSDSRPHTTRHRGIRTLAGEGVSA